MRKAPEFFKAQSPWANVARIIKNKRAAREVELKSAYPVLVVGKHVCVGKMAQVVRALPDINGVRKTRNQLNQSRHIYFQPIGVVYHHADSSRCVGLEKCRQLFDPAGFTQTQRHEGAIENDNFPLGATNDGIACLAIVGFTGQQMVLGIQDGRHSILLLRQPRVAKG